MKKFEKMLADIIERLEGVHLRLESSIEETEEHRRELVNKGGYFFHHKHKLKKALSLHSDINRTLNNSACLEYFIITIATYADPKELKVILAMIGNAMENAKKKNKMKYALPSLEDLQEILLCFEKENKKGG